MQPLSARHLTDSVAVSSTSRMATAAAYVYGLLVAAAVGHFLLGIPIQLTDSYGNMLKLDTPWPDLLVNELYQRAYLRPLLFAELKLVYDVSGGEYFWWYRGVHVAQVFGLILLYLGLVRPTTWRDAAIVPFGLAVLLGIHTFTGTVVEAFPINTFMTILLCCAAAANLALMRNRWWVDVLAALLFVVAALTVESGLLVWVIFVGAALTGARGLSRTGLGLQVALLTGYFVLRFGILQVGSPQLLERSSGYGFQVLDPDRLIAAFGENPLPFYAYNVATSAASVLFSEPRAGVFRLVHGLTMNDPAPSAIVNVIASTSATLLIVVFVARRWRGWLAGRLDRDDRLVLLFLMVLAANATISYPYTKDVIMSPAGVFFAVAAFAAARDVLPASGRTGGWRASAALLACAVLATTWSVRVVGLHLNLRDAGRKVRSEWAYLEDWIARQGATFETPREIALLRQLQHDAIFERPAPPTLPLVDHPVVDVE